MCAPQDRAVRVVSAGAPGLRNIAAALASTLHQTRTTAAAACTLARLIPPAKMATANAITGIVPKVAVVRARAATRTTAVVACTLARLIPPARSEERRGGIRRADPSA